MLCAAALVAASLAIVAGCGGERESRPSTYGPSSAVPAQPLSVEEALASDADGPLLVRGTVYAERDRVRLCSGFAESYPPQCVGPSLELDGLDLTTIDGLRREGSITWSETPVRVLGTVRGKTLVVTKNAVA